MLLAGSCPNRDQSSTSARPVAKNAADYPRTPIRPPTEDQRWHLARDRMVETQLLARGITDERVVAAMRSVRRHEFVPLPIRTLSYADRPLPIGHGQTISQPYIVAYMTEALKLSPDARVLEIGTGSGYQAAVLAKIAKEVYSIEIVEPLAKSARQLLRRLGCRHVHLRTGDGYQGWPEAAPFDRIILTAAPSKIPTPLLAQLKIGGMLLAPEGTNWQVLVRVTRTKKGFRRERLLDVRFVPMTGRAQQQP